MNRIRNPEPAANPELRNLRAIRPLAALGALLLALAAGATELPHSTACTAPPLPEQNGGRLVIIIDDMGNNLRRGLSALELPGRLTYAVIPFTPFATTLADAAVAGGKEVMLHAPMSTVEDMPLERGALTSNLSREVFRQALRDALSQQRRQMAWLMQELRTHDLYFVDSRTSDKTVAATVAAEFNVPHLSRQVFLDNERTLEAIDARFREVLALIDETGFAVAIGHPYPETIAYLRAALPLLAQTGIELAYVSDMVARIQPASACPQTPGTNADAVAG